MSSILAWMAQIAGRSLPLVANHLWQATLFASAVWLVAALLLKRAPAQVRYFVWLIVAAKFALPSALLALLLNRAGLHASLVHDSRDTNSFTFITETTQPVLHPFQSAAAIAPPAHAFLFCALITIWLVGTITLLICWWVKRRKFLRDVRGSETITGGRAWEKLCAAQSQLKVKTKIRLIVSPRVGEPGVWGVWRSLILLPAGLAERLTDVELEALMLHELLHVKRRDNFVSHAQMLLRCVWWFHPLVWFVDRRLLAERERACDEAALISLSGAREAYVSSVLKVLRFCVHSPVAGASGMADSDLQRRLRYIMDFKQDRRWTLWQACALGVAGVALVAVTFVAGAFDANSALAQTTVGGRGAGQGSTSAQSGGNANGGGGQRQRRRAARRPNDSDFDAQVDADTDADTNEIAPPVQPSEPFDAQDTERAEAEAVQLPARPVRFENKADAPMTLTSASMKPVPGEVMRRIYRDGNFPSETYSSLPVVALVNNSNERITTVYLRFSVNGRKGGVILGRAAVIDPQNAYTFQTEFKGLNAMLPVALEEILVTLDAVEFEGGKRWGKSLPPHPPMPPSPPSPPAPPSQPPPPSPPVNGQSSSLRLLHRVE
nr:M56 family metallopeptidase [Pyrinomonadaceae bacterium]